MKNELPLKSWTHESGVLNLNDSNVEGSHWVVWIKEGNKKNNFHSYGEFNPPTELVNYLGKKNLLISTNIYQDFNDPPICGHLCYFINFIKNL
jgi:hypothetical protein